MLPPTVARNLSGGVLPALLGSSLLLPIVPLPAQDAPRQVVLLEGVTTEDASIRLEPPSSAAGGLHRAWAAGRTATGLRGEWRAIGGSDAEAHRFEIAGDAGAGAPPHALAVAGGAMVVLGVEAGAGAPQLVARAVARDASVASPAIVLAPAAPESIRALALTTVGARRFLAAWIESAPGADTVVRVARLEVPSTAPASRSVETQTLVTWKDSSPCEGRSFSLSRATGANVAVAVALASKEGVRIETAISTDAGESFGRWKPLPGGSWRSAPLPRVDCDVTMWDTIQSLRNQPVCAFTKEGRVLVAPWRDGSFDCGEGRLPSLEFSDGSIYVALTEPEGDAFRLGVYHGNGPVSWLDASPLLAAGWTTRLSELVTCGDEVWASLRDRSEQGSRLRAVEVGWAEEPVLRKRE